MADYSNGRLLTVLRQTADPFPDSAQRALKILRVGAWFEGLRCSLGLDTAYALGKRIQPQTYQARKAGRWPQHHNLWAKYAHGIHVPGPETLGAAQRLSPGSSDVLTTVAWQILDVSRPIGDQGDTLLRRLRPDVQLAVFDQRALSAARYVRRPGPTRPLRMLEARADLDGLAALVLLLREAYEAGQHHHAFTIGRSLYAALLMTTCTCSLYWLSPELFAFFIRWIFPLASDEDIGFDLCRNELCEQQRHLIRTIQQLEDNDQISANTRNTWFHRKIPNGKFGFDLQFGLGPRWVLMRPAKQCSATSRDFVASMEVARNWGLKALRSGRPERLMPRDVIKRMAEAGRLARDMQVPDQHEEDLVSTK